MREGTTFDAQADVWGFAVVYPDGWGGCWADGRGVTTADEAGVDDVAFLRALIDWSAGHHGTSGDRAVVAGISNGAFMAHRMALEAGGQVAVLAAVAGGLPASLCDVRPSHAVSAMLIHGTANAVSPIAGGYSRHRGPNGELRGRTLSLEETAGFWRAVDRCRPDPATYAPRSSPAGSRRRAARAGRGSPPGRCSAAATPGRVPRLSRIRRDDHPGIRRRRGDLPLRSAPAHSADPRGWQKMGVGEVSSSGGCPALSGGDAPGRMRAEAGVVGEPASPGKSRCRRGSSWSI